jgi:hypothetical protein
MLFFLLESSCSIRDRDVSPLRVSIVIDHLDLSIHGFKESGSLEEQTWI